VEHLSGAPLSGWLMTFSDIDKDDKNLSAYKRSSLFRPTDLGEEKCSETFTPKKLF
jgi:hypothetical protein